MKCIEDEILFDVPEGWEWCRLKNICMMSAGKFKSSDLIKDEPFDSSYPCFGGNGIRGYVDEFNQDGTFSIVGRQGALCGNINIATGKFYATEHAVVTYLYSGIDFSWNNYILEALNLNSYASGAAQPGLSVANVLNILVPLPPYDEQSRIGNKISTASSLIENIDNQKKELLNIINLANIKTLELAIRGKLVPQNSSDESASVLLERIRSEKENLIKAGKIKRDKKESVIYRGDDNSYYEKFTNGNIININDNIPFELPRSWEFTRLNCIIQKEIKRGKSPKYADISNTMVFAQKCNLKKGGINISLAQCLDENILSKYSAEEFMQNEDIVINSTGTGTLGRVGIYHHSDNPLKLKVVPDSHVTTVRVSSRISADFVYICLKSLQPYLENQGEGSTNQKELKPTTIKNLILPIPSYEEQIRIVSRVKQVIKSLEEIEAVLI